MQILIKRSGIPEGNPENSADIMSENEKPQDSMFFGPNAKESTEENGENQMWFSESSRLMDWLIEDEDM
jgi:hypothetical protein